MAKNKKAAKMPAKKADAKKVGKKPTQKAPSKNEKVMTKKNSKPLKKVSGKKVDTKKALAKKVEAKKAPVKKVAAKKAPAKKAAPKKTATKPEVKKASKSLKDQVIKAAEKIVAKVAPKVTKEKKEKVVVSKSKEKVKKEAKAPKEKAPKEKAPKKRIEKEPKVSKKSKKEEEDFFDDVPFEEPKSRRSVEEDDDLDEFEEDYKKSKEAKKNGRKPYELEDEVDLFESKPSKKYKNQVIEELEAKISDGIAELREHFNWKDISDAINSMDFFIDPKNDECIEKGCDNIRTTQSYCRLHYLRNWKNIQKKKEILQEGKLQEYIEELISKYPPKYIEALLSDLSDDKDFYKVLNELNITSEFDYEEDEYDSPADDDSDDDDLGIETISTSLRYEDE